MHKCVAKSVNASVAYNVNDKTGCNALLPENEYAWKNSNINFDHIGNALITLFFVSMGDGWVYIMRMATDSRSEEDANPRRDARGCRLLCPLHHHGVLSPSQRLRGDHLGQLQARG